MISVVLVVSVIFGGFGVVCKTGSDKTRNEGNGNEEMENFHFLISILIIVMTTHRRVGTQMARISE